MTIWDEQFEEHPVFPALEQAAQAVAGSAESLSDAVQTEGHARLRRVLDYTRETLGTVDPQLVYRPSLDTIANNLNGITSCLQQFLGSPEQRFLDDANGNADEILAHVHTLRSMATTKDVEGLQASVSSFRRSIGQHARNLERQLSEVEGRAQGVDQRLGAQEEKAEAQEADIDNVVAQLQQQFSNEQAERQSQFSGVLETARSEFATTLDEARGGTDEAVAEASTASTEAVEAIKTAADDLLARTAKAADDQLNELKQRVEDRLEELNTLRAEAERAVSATGAAVLAGGYQKVANAETKAANIWRLIAAMAFVGATGVAIFAVAHGISAGFDIERFFAKIAIGIPIVALAYYAAHESSKHREQASLNRKVELQLASLDAYLRELPEAERHSIKAKLADGFFESRTRTPSTTHAGGRSHPAQLPSLFPENESG